MNLPEIIQEKHKIIHKNSKRLSRLIDELMDFRKLQFSKIELNVSKFDLIPFANEVASHFEEEGAIEAMIEGYLSHSTEVFSPSAPEVIDRFNSIRGRVRYHA